MTHDQCSCHFYGLYRGKVVDTADPEGLLRVRVVVPQVFGSKAVPQWAWPCIPVGATSAPAIDAVVWIMFIAGDPEHPVWVGTWKTA